MDLNLDPARVEIGRHLLLESAASVVPPTVVTGQQIGHQSSQHFVGPDEGAYHLGGIL